MWSGVRYVRSKYDNKKYANRVFGPNLWVWSAQNNIRATTVWAP